MVAHDDIKQILSVELLALSVQPNSRLDQFIDFQVLEVKFNGWVFVSRTGEPREEDFDMIDELVDEPLVEGMRKEGLLCPKLHDLDVLDPRQPTILELGAVVLGKGLWHFLSILSQPVSFRVPLLQLKLAFDDLVYLLFFCRFKLPNE